MHDDAVRRLRALLGRPPALPPELLEVERRAEVAMTPCTCEHPWHRHEHYYHRTECASCGCERFRPALPMAGVPVAGAHRSSAIRDLVVHARVLGLTRSWQHEHRA